MPARTALHRTASLRHLPAAGQSCFGLNGDPPHAVHLFAQGSQPCIWTISIQADRNRLDAPGVTPQPALSRPPPKARAGRKESRMNPDSLSVPLPAGHGPFFLPVFPCALSGTITGAPGPADLQPAMGEPGAGRALLCIAWGRDGVYRADNQVDQGPKTDLSRPGTFCSLWEKS